MESKAVIKDEAPEWHWWTRLPNIVLSKVGDPYELALLFVIRKVAGDDPDDGVCYMNLHSLAGQAKMDIKTARKKIHSLVKKGLIRAELKIGPRGFKVWHITLPRSLWEENEAAYHQLSVPTEPVIEESPTTLGREPSTTLGRETPTTLGRHTKNHTMTKNPSLKRGYSPRPKKKEQLMLKSTPETRYRYLKGEYAEQILS